jgi:hypothetical protein
VRRARSRRRSIARRLPRIDPFLREVREAQIENSLEEFQRICGGGYIEFGIWINRKDVLYVNDFAHWRESFVIGEQRVFSGCGLITGGNGSGNDMDRSARVPLDEIRRVVRFAAAKAR